MTITTSLKQSTLTICFIRESNPVLLSESLCAVALYATFVFPSHHYRPLLVLQKLDWDVPYMDVVSRYYHFYDFQPNSSQCSSYKDALKVKWCSLGCITLWGGITCPEIWLVLIMSDDFYWRSWGDQFNRSSFITIQHITANLSHFNDHIRAAKISQRID